MHPIIHDLTRRYTVKKYDPNKRIADSDIEIIKEALRLSASSINSQPWKFILLSSDQAKQTFHDSFANKHQFNQHHALEASHTILFAYNPKFDKAAFKKVVDLERDAGRFASEEKYLARLNVSFGFAELNTDSQGINSEWTKSQLYLALGNALHTLARLGIDSTAMEGIDSNLIGELFADELDGYICPFALAMGYPLAEQDVNHGLVKSRLPLQDVFTVL